MKAIISDQDQSNKIIEINSMPHIDIWWFYTRETLLLLTNMRHEAQSDSISIYSTVDYIGPLDNNDNSLISTNMFTPFFCF